MKQTAVKDLAYYKANAEEDYLAVPISVLRYISQLEQEQDKNKYSEEDLREAFRQGQDNMDYSEIYGWDSKLTEQEWFEKVKKK
jgi:hypothetical protein